MSTARKANFGRDGDVGFVTIDAPPLNLFDRKLFEDLRTAFDAARSDGVRALVVRAEGKVFTGGADVHVFDGLEGDAAREFVEEILAVTHQVEDLPFPTVASVHSLCLTAGLELALACDLIVAAESARFGLVERVVGLTQASFGAFPAADLRFGLVERVVGLTPLMGGTQRIAERAGPARAREFVMTGAILPAAKLAEWGVINRVVPDGNLEQETLSLARDLAAGPTRAHYATKRIVRAVVDEGVRAADAITPALGEEVFATEDLKAGVRAFLDHGGPGHARFVGR
ncbi:enoyl-CoA hydratase/isomerase family protein [Thermoleophilum album]|uniref:enoyl-CoA hydratase/isomerase family protein n=1 Tax=Thermoleophilum album TaxID=29539 RepID=UPI00237CDEC0|nr:enoyl-CoA hydratase/isomerase family protein [Thermoleophilum album]WDT93088.1 enoyl-CoA hydratase/isomerase family protein [Thermoleophilum album]